MRRYLLATLAALVVIAFPGKALAAGGSYTFDGGTPAEQGQVRAALNASSFDWSLIPATITVHITPSAGEDYATQGQVFLDPALLDEGEFSWATVQHEFGHQVDFYLLDDAKRGQLEATLGGQQWFYTQMTLPHSAYGCERFASELSWAYWQSPENALAPRSSADEAGGMPTPQFRTLLSQLIGAPNASAAGATASAGTKLYAPKLTRAATSKSKKSSR